MFNLKPPQSVFVHADGFLKAVSYLNKPPGTPQFDPFVFAACVTNSAFASELYFKCLIQIDTGQIFRNEHDLRTLFLKLPDTTQKEIETPFNEKLAKTPRHDLSQASKEVAAVSALLPKNLREALKSGGNAFVKWRYIYEDDAYANAFSLFHLPPILRKAILARHPEWAHFSIKLKKIIRPPQPTSPAQNTPAEDASEHPQADNQSSPQ